MLSKMKGNNANFSEQEKNIIKALKEVDLIEKGLLPKKSANDFLNESRQENMPDDFFDVLEEEMKEHDETLKKLVDR